MSAILTKYEEASVGAIPKEWELMRLEEVIKEIKNGFASGKRDENGIVQVRMNNVTTDGRLTFDSYIKVPIPKNIDEFILKKNDFLFNNTNSVDLVGKSAIFKSAPFPCTYSNHFTRLRFTDQVLPEWVLLHFISLWRKGYFKSVAIRHVGQAAVQTKFITNIKIPLPTLPEQQKIAEILSTVDDAIAKVDEAIGKTEKLKKGLMHELFTKGIGNKEFKDTEIGKLPVEWNVLALSEVSDVNRESVDPTKEFPDKKFLYIDIDAVENGTGVIKGAKEIVGKDAPSRARRVVYHKDVLMSTVRPYLKAFAIVPRAYDSQICSTGFAVLTSKQQMLPLYLLYSLFTKSVIEQCQKMMRGGQYPALNTSQVSNIKIPVPPLSEQQRIAGILSAIDEKLELLAKKKGQFEKIKRALMNDLLTGKRRVRI